MPRTDVLQPAALRGAGEVGHRVAAQERERRFRRELGPQIFHADRRLGFAALPEQIDHVAVGADRRAAILVLQPLDQAANALVQELSHGHAPVHECRERLLGIEHHQPASGLQLAGVSAQVGEMRADARGARRRRNNERRLIRLKADADELGDGPAQIIGVFVELDGVAGTKAFEHLGAWGFH